MPEQRKGFEWIWPAVDTPESARFAMRQAFWAAIFVCGMTAAFAIASLFASSTDSPLPLAPWALVDAAIFAAIAFGIWRESRVAAVAGLGVYIIEQLHLLTIPVRRGAGSFLIVAALLVAFIGGIRGAFALHQMRTRDLRQS
jgi:hypothetical protein